MSTWHNRFGEKGQRLTILSLLAPMPVDLNSLDLDAEMSLREAIDELFRIGGQDGAAQLVLDVIGKGSDAPDFSVEENVSLRELADRLCGAYGSDGDSASLRMLKPGDELFDEWAALESGDSPGDDEANGQAGFSPLRRFRETVHRLFGGSAEQGVPPTVVGLLVGPTLGSKADGS
jgi:hypothetical protein